MPSLESFTWLQAHEGESVYFTQLHVDLFGIVTEHVELALGTGLETVVFQVISISRFSKSSHLSKSSKSGHFSKSSHFLSSGAHCRRRLPLRRAGNVLARGFDVLSRRCVPH